jgi:HD-GYP domain-containing protein (c-di-GMP phosphodiesterase class II)
MDIIREGAGTQFDPEVAEIFIEAADEVRQITIAHESMLNQGVRNFSD